MVLWQAGGILVIEGATATLTDCNVYENTATSARSGGGGIYLSGATSPLPNSRTTLNNCNVYQNAADGVGGGLYSVGGDLVLNGGSIFSNTATTVLLAS